MMRPAAKVIAACRGDSHGAVSMPDEFGSRWGTGEVQPTSVGLFNGEGQPVEHPRTFDPFNVRVNLTAHAPIQDSVLVARIDQIGGHTVWHSLSRRNGVTIGLIDGSATAEISFDAPPLLEGTYELTLGITDHTEVHPDDWWERRIRFDARQFAKSDHGVVSIPTSWKIEGASSLVELG